MTFSQRLTGLIMIYKNGICPLFFLALGCLYLEQSVLSDLIGLFSFYLYCKKIFLKTIEPVKILCFCFDGTV